MRILVGTLLSFLLTLPAFASPSFMPPNNLDQLKEEHAAGGITQVQFNAVIARANSIYGPIIKAHGATLTINPLWTDSTVNADSSQPSPTDWQVNMYGGLAQRPEVTEDGFAMVLCHELGHHLGGFPFIGGADWAANEGQADTHATGACAAKVFAANMELTVKAASDLPADVKAKCDAAHPNDGGTCYRIMNASLSLANLLAALENSKVSFETPDTSVVSATNDDHPAAQCRLDTYAASALCGNSKWDYTLIPGKGSDEGSVATQTIGFAHSCEGDVTTQRPRCWFAPLDGNSPTPTPTPAPTACPLGDPSICAAVCQIDPSEPWCK